MKTKKTSDDIFRLVKSLSKVEVGYFIQYINRSRIKDGEYYIRMVKHIRSLEEYNEAEIKTALKNAAFAKRFAYHKTTLSGLLIDSLVAYRSNTSVASQLNRLKEAIQLTYEKHLYSHTHKLIDKARALALLYENHFALLEINNSYRIFLNNTGEAKLIKSIEDIYNEQKELLEKIDNHNKLVYIKDKVNAIYKTFNTAKSPAKLEELEKLMQHPLLSDEKMALSFSAKLAFNYTHAVYQQLVGNEIKTYQYRQRIIELWDMHPQMKTEYVVRYRADLGNLLTKSIASKTSLNFEEILKLIEKNSGGSKEDHAFAFSEVYVLMQYKLLNNHQFAEALKLIPAVERGLKKFGNAIMPVRKFVFLYNIAITYFLNEKYAEALPYFERITHANRKQEVRTDLRDLCSIFRIILLYQTGKHDLVEYEVRNTRDRLKYGNKLYELEQTVLEYIPLLIKSQKQIPNFLEKLEELFSRPENKNLLGLEEIIIWLKKTTT